MEIRQLRYFLAVATTGSFTRAAEKCNVAQPSLSQQIGVLEDEVGERLFHRRPREVVLTDAGRQLLDYAADILNSVEAAEKLFEGRREELTGVLRLGIIPTVAPFLLPTLLAKFREEYPEIRMEIMEAKTQELVRMVASEEVDLAVVSDIRTRDDVQISVHVMEIYEEELFLGVHQSHRLIRERGTPPDLTIAVELEQIPEEDLMHLRAGHCLRDQTIKVCQQEIKAKIECDQLWTLASLVNQNYGIAFFPQSSIPYLANQTEIRFLHLDSDLRRPVNLMRRRVGHDTPVSQAFQKTLQELDRVSAPEVK